MALQQTFTVTGSHTEATLKNFHTGSYILLSYLGTSLSAVVLHTVHAIIHPVQDPHFSAEEKTDFAMSSYVKQQSWESWFSLARAVKFRMEMRWTSLQINSINDQGCEVRAPT